MLASAKVVNTSKTVAKVSLRRLIQEEFTQENGKVFYSIEATPSAGLQLDFREFKILPLFVDLTWIRDENLKFPLTTAPAFEVAEKLSCTQVVNSITCYNLAETQLDEILGRSDMITNFTVLRGGEDRRFAYKSTIIRTISVHRHRQRRPEI